MTSTGRGVALMLALACSTRGARADPLPASDAPLVERHGDMLCLSPAAVVASERDREAWKRQLTEAQAVQVVPVVLAGVLGIAVGVGVALVVSGATKKP